MLIHHVRRVLSRSRSISCVLNRTVGIFSENNYVIQNPCLQRSNKSTRHVSSLREIVKREMDEEKHSGNNVMPPELKELYDLVNNEWSIVDNESSGIVTLHKKGTSGGKIAIQFHCQDTEEPPAIEEEEEVMEESSNGLRFLLCVNKEGINMVFACLTEGGDTNIETIVMRDGVDVEDGFNIRGTENLYQGPEFVELAEDLQGDFISYLKTECGVDETVSAFISMYSDFKEQAEYFKWLTDVQKIIS